MIEEELVAASPLRLYSRGRVGLQMVTEVNKEADIVEALAIFEATRPRAHKRPCLP
jgi:hypothetical protein